MSAPQDRFCNHGHAGHARREGTEAGRERRCSDRGSSWSVAPCCPRRAGDGRPRALTPHPHAPTTPWPPHARRRAPPRATYALCRRRVSAADAAYATALDGLASAVTSQVEAEQIADDATLRAEAASRAQRQHLQQVYLSGGTNVLDLTLSDGPVAASQGSDYLMRLVERDRRAVTLDPGRAGARGRLCGLDGPSGRAPTGRHRRTGARTGTTRSRRCSTQAQSRLEQLSADGAQPRGGAGPDQGARRAEGSCRRGSVGCRAARQGRWDSRRTTSRCTKRPRRPAPGLPWVVLAAIGQVESGHGSQPQRLLSRRPGPDAVPARHLRRVRGGRRRRRRHRHPQPGGRHLHRGGVPVREPCRPRRQRPARRDLSATTTRTGTSSWSSTSPPSSRSGSASRPAALRARRSDLRRCGLRQAGAAVAGAAIWPANASPSAPIDRDSSAGMTQILLAWPLAICGSDWR